MNELKDQYILLNTITNKKPTTLIAHSSGAIEALKACNYLDNIKNVVLLDPVDTRFAFDKANKDKIIIQSFVSRLPLIYEKNKSPKYWAPFILISSGVNERETKDFEVKWKSKNTLGNYNHVLNLVNFNDDVYLLSNISVILKCTKCVL